MFKGKRWESPKGNEGWKGPGGEGERARSGHLACCFFKTEFQVQNTTEHGGIFVLFSSISWCSCRASLLLQAFIVQIVFTFFCNLCTVLIVVYCWFYCWRRFPLLLSCCFHCCLFLLCCFQYCVLLLVLHIVVVLLCCIICSYCFCCLLFSGGFVCCLLSVVSHCYLSL